MRRRQHSDVLSKCRLHGELKGDDESEQYVERTLELWSEQSEQASLVPTTEPTPTPVAVFPASRIEPAASPSAPHQDRVNGNSNAPDEMWKPTRPGASTQEWRPGNKLMGSRKARRRLRFSIGTGKDRVDVDPQKVPLQDGGSAFLSRDHPEYNPHESVNWAPGHGPRSGEPKGMNHHNQNTAPEHEPKENLPKDLHSGAVSPGPLRSRPDPSSGSASASKINSPSLAVDGMAKQMASALDKEGYEATLRRTSRQSTQPVMYEAKPAAYPRGTQAESKQPHKTSATVYDMKDGERVAIDTARFGEEYAKGKPKEMQGVIVKHLKGKKLSVRYDFDGKMLPSHHTHLRPVGKQWHPKSSTGQLDELPKGVAADPVLPEARPVRDCQRGIGACQRGIGGNNTRPAERLARPKVSMSRRLDAQQRLCI